MSRYWHTRAVIIRSRSLRDSDRLVTIFSEDSGKLTAVAKGVSKPKSSLRACVQPFCHSRLQLTRGRGMDLISQGQIIEFFGHSREDLNCTLQMVYLMELLDKSLPESMAFPELYHHLLFVLGEIERRGEQSLLLRYFEAQLLKYNGYHPQLDACVRCEAPLSGSRRLSAAEGGGLCGDCGQRAGPDNTLTVDAETASLLTQLFTGQETVIARLKASPRAIQKLEAVLESFLEYHLERRYNTKHLIRYFKQRQ
ncbi:MAG: DNA repair protein RecO [Syntrophomonadaceae bacterium]|nr:DNA repair protein RecO [Syntrophomonadaceae bacterium]